MSWPGQLSRNGVNAVTLPTGINPSFTVFEVSDWSTDLSPAHSPAHCIVECSGVYLLNSCGVISH